MAPEPPQRRLLSQLVEASKTATSAAKETELAERRNIFNNPGFGSVIKARIRGLKRDLSALKTTEELLQEQLSVLERLKAHAHNAAQPICRLPDEILSAIFVVGLPGVTDCWVGGPRTPTKPKAWTRSRYRKTRRSIGATCSRLRTAQISTPRCWTFFGCMITKDILSGDTLLELELMLIRSKNSPLAVSVITQGDAPSLYALRAISTLLRPHLARCYDLRLRSEDDRTTLPLRVPPALLQNVQHIELSWKGSGRLDLDSDGDSESETGSDSDSDSDSDLEPQGRSDKTEDAMLSMVAACGSSLQSIRIFGGTQSFRGSFDTVQVETLTRLAIDVKCSWKDIVSLLHRCARLEHLYLQLWSGGHQTLGVSTMPLVLDNLLSVQTHGKIGHERSCLLHAPQLEQLCVYDAVSGAPFSVLYAQQSSFPSLTRLALRVSVGSRRKVFAQFLRHHPQLIECAISLDNNTDEVPHIRAVAEPLLYAPHDVRASLSRNLRHLSLDIRDDDSELTAKNIAEFEQETNQLLRLLLVQYTDLRIYIHVPQFGLRRPCFIIPDVEVRSRLIVNPKACLDQMWPDAWMAPAQT